MNNHHGRNLAQARVAALKTRDKLAVFDAVAKSINSSDFKLNRAMRRSKEAKAMAHGPQQEVA